MAYSLARLLSFQTKTDFPSIKNILLYITAPNHHKTLKNVDLPHPLLISNTVLFNLPHMHIFACLKKVQLMCGFFAIKYSVYIRKFGPNYFHLITSGHLLFVCEKCR